MNIFLKLSVAVRILLHTNECISKNNCAEQLLKEFVSSSSNMYESSLITYNYHCLTHLAENCLKFGSMESFSAFKFEYKLGKIKRLLRKKKFNMRSIVQQTFRKKR